MHKRLDSDRRVIDEFFDGVSDFIFQAQMHARSKYETSLIPCPCSKCRNIGPLPTDDVFKHLVKFGFVENYFYWEQHGESSGMNHDNVAEPSCPVLRDEYHTMVGDGMGFAHGVGVGDSMGFAEDVGDEDMTEATNRSVVEYYELLHAASDLVYEDCAMTKLSLVSQLINLKSESQISQRNHERYVSIMQRLTPDQGRNIPSTYYEAKKVLLPLRLQHKKIDACIDNCMLFYREDADLTSCLHCGKSRYKPDSGHSTGRKVAQKVLT
ncbi:hypothetical protein LIER_31642 [Lithospermum erythrorhizon]|uniref:Transposase-associated domain-containing protein n=1 Tax=Lithospermum erythrorhizon TaxID=34254 RepID=A0AAV3RV76_LITER